MRPILRSSVFLDIKFSLVTNWIGVPIFCFSLDSNEKVNLTVHQKLEESHLLQAMLGLRVKAST